MGLAWEQATLEAMGMKRAEIIEAVRQAVQALDQEQKAVARHFLVTLLAKLEKRR